MVSMVFRIVLFILAAALTAAHFLRAENHAMVALSVATPLLFLYRKPASLVLLQLAAYAATSNWLIVALLLVQLRQQIGRPWTVAAIILGAVALLTLLAGLLLNARGMRERYS
jgi:uncharacterized membrane protein HdeD (DUF308 family)